MAYRVRLTYTKTGPIRYTGHLDLCRVWERAIRRANLPIAFSQGFHPQARMNLACALPLGMTSRCELIDLWLVDPLPLAEVQARLNGALSPGLEICAIAEVEEHAPALQTQVSSSVYRAMPLDPVDQGWLQEQVARLLASVQIIRTRREKPYDLRPLIESLECQVDAATGQASLVMRLAAREGATGRPEEVLAALGLDPALARVERTELILV
jgi:radical SAM-linked protein